MNSIRHIFHLKLSLLVFIIFFFLSGNLILAAGEQATDIEAFHRRGQTFLTWQECTTVNNEQYRVYRHTEPITSYTLPNATIAATVSEGSGQFKSDTLRNGTPTYFVINDRGVPLSPSTGLFVHTAHENGNFYYAVTVVIEDNENTLVSSSNTTLSITEIVADPTPVIMRESSDGNGRVYTQWMDYAEWNVTFDGEYAYNYWVGVPSNWNRTTPLPLYVHMEGWGSRYEEESNGTPWGWQAFEIHVDDMRQSWYYGYSATYDYSQGGTPDSGPIVNFTEQRIMRAVYDVIRDPYYKIDTNRIYAFGHSMGASGALALGMRYPNVFAAVYCSEPMTNYKASSMWVGDVTPKWGSVQNNLPIENRGVYANHLQKYDGTGVFDWQNHQDQLMTRSGDEMAYINLAHGLQDSVIDWQTQGRPTAGALNASGQVFSSTVTNGGHSWQGFAGIGPMWNFDSFNYRKDRAALGISNLSGNPAIPPDSTGSYNMTVEWSTPWNDFADDVVDTQNTLEVVIRSTQGMQTADITPHRLRNFIVETGQTYDWENHLLSGEMVQQGSITADNQGRITIPGFQITQNGNRLSLTAGSGEWSRLIPDTSHGVYIWADQLQTHNDSQNEFVARHFVASQKLTKDRIDAIRKYNPDFIVMQYHKAYGVDIGGNIVGPNEWGPDIATMNEFVANNPQYGDLEDYYIHWTNENDPDHRVQHYWAGNLEFHLADIRHAGFRAYMIHETKKRCEQVGFDGTFFDVAYFPWYAYEPDYDTSVGFGGSGMMWYEYPPWNWPSINEGASTLADNWNSLVVPYWQEITGAYHAGETKYYSIVNCDRMVTGWYEHVSLDDVDGAMSENWMTGGDSNNRLIGNDWELSASRILHYITGNNKILIAQPNEGGSGNLAMREWWIANYFLLKNAKSFYFYAYSMDLYWWPEYEIDLGAFVQSPTRDLNDLLVGGTQSLYARSYEKGLVLVNPGESPQQYTLEGTFYRYTFSGGGYVETNQKPTMTLEHAAPMTGTVSVEPHTALILWKPAGDVTVYVSPDGSCDDHTPCFSRIQEAIDWDNTTFTVKVEQGIYDAGIALNQLKQITIQGGWNSSFTMQTSGTTVIKAPTVSNGSLTFQNVNIRP